MQSGSLRSFLRFFVLAGLAAAVSFPAGAWAQGKGTQQVGPDGKIWWDKPVKGADITPPADRVRVHQKGAAVERARIGYTLLRVIAAANETKAIAIAQQNRVPLRTGPNGERLVTVILEPRKTGPSLQIDEAKVVALGGRVDAVSRSFMRVLVPFDGIDRLAEHPDVALVRAPAVMNPNGFGAVVSESVGITGAAEMIAGGFTGQGVKVAVMDGGFIGLNDAIAASELPADTTIVDMTGQGIEAGIDHGTVVSEHVMDMAPGVELTVIRVGDRVDMENGADYLRDNGIHIANHSGGWATNSYYDDTGPINDLFNESRDVDGVFWVVSAGNAAEGHWRGGWEDEDSDTFLEFRPGDEEMRVYVRSTSRPILNLNWNQYGNSVTDLDLYVVRHNTDGSLTTVASSQGPQTGAQYPREGLGFTPATNPDTGSPYQYSLRIEHFGGPMPEDMDMTIIGWDCGLEYMMAESAMIDPAVAHGTFTVGAVDFRRWNDAVPVIEFFSSHGPTNDGRLKPDLVGPDYTSSSTWGPTAASGTSFSAPTVAGAAALLLSEDMGLTANDLDVRLKAMARETGDIGPDTIFGYGRLQVMMQGTGQPPEAVDDVAVIDEDGQVTIDVLANDSDPDGDPVTVVDVGMTPNGEAVINGDDTITYTPDENFFGIDTFTYIVTDGNGWFSNANVTVTVNPTPDVPIARDDGATTLPGMPVIIAVLDNDEEPDNDPLSISAIDDPPNGTAVDNGDGTITYTPDGGFDGQDTFDYTVTDGLGNTATATVTVLVTADNIPPTANDDFYVSDEDRMMVFGVLENDTDLNGDALTIQQVMVGQNGVAFPASSTEVRFIPRANFHGQATFSYIVRDPAGATDQATAFVTVRSINDYPTAVLDTATTVGVQPVVIDVLANDFDLDDDELSVSEVSEPDNGAAVLNGDDTVTYTADPGFDGLATFTYTVVDGIGGHRVGDVEVTVHAPPTAEWIAYNDMSLPSDNGVAAPNVTSFDYRAENATLINFDTGAALPVQFSGAATDWVTTNDGAAPGPDTDAAGLFGGVIDTRGIDELQAPHWQSAVTLNNLDPTRAYTISLSANLGTPAFANQRFTRVTLSGADEFTNESTDGVVVYNPDSVSFATGDNTSEGYVARWSGIRPGADRSFTITSQWDVTRPGPKSHPMTYFRLEEWVPEAELCQNDADCNDFNPCTDDTCDVGTGACGYANNTLECDDGVACTLFDQCLAGVCAGAPDNNQCDDGNVCTNNICSLVQGCLNPNNTAGCDDGVACTSGDVCAGGACSGVPDNNQCDDGNECTHNICNPVQGCMHPNNAADCDDGVACTAADVCAGGACAGVPDDNQCGDGDVCTDDVCDPVQGCLNPNNTADCDDGVACTGGDVCAGGACAGVPDPNQCNDGNVCTNDVCNPVQGCINPNNAADCDDGVACTGGDVCAAGVCAGTDACEEGSICDLEAGECLREGGEFVASAYNDLAWGRGQPLAGITRLTSPNGGSGLPAVGLLVDHETGAPMDITLEVIGGVFDGRGHANDGRTALPGTDAHATFGGILDTDGAISYFSAYNSPLVLRFSGLDPAERYQLVFHGNRGSYGWSRASMVTLVGADAFVNTSSDADDNPAPGSGGSLFSGPGDPSTRLPSDNDDGYVARFTDIEPGPDGLVELSILEDGTSGFRGKYASAVALHQLFIGCAGDAECDDGNVCTDDTCNLGTGECQNVNNQAPCDDGIECTTLDECNEGACVGNVPNHGACNDSNVCTNDICVSGQGCLNNPNVAPCDDGLACTVNDVCGAGICAGVSDCAEGEICNPLDGQCIPEPDCVVDSDCNDGNPCTRDTCNVIAGQCIVEETNDPCDDGVACTVGDQCANGVCNGGVPDDGQCDDGNVCTDNTCHPVLGCRATNNVNACDAGLGCTEGDQCADGACVAGAPNNALCSDDNVCTDDVCNPATGCEYPNNVDPCDDGLGCTANDLCDLGVCLGSDACPEGQACDVEAGVCRLTEPEVVYRAYNDLAWGGGQLQHNITRVTAASGGSGLPDSGELVDYETGDFTGVTLTVVGGRYDGGGHSDDGANAAPGTDAFEIFDGIVETEGAIAYSGSFGSPLILSFTGLDPDGEYGVVFNGDRGAYGWTRSSLVTLTGVDAFINDSSVSDQSPEPASGGALFSGPDDPSTHVPSDNAAGYVARFIQIDPGDDGAFDLVIDADGSAAPRGKYASAVMLEQYASGCAIDADCDDGNPCTDGTCDGGTGACVFVNNQIGCDDGFACTGNDQCTDGVCLGGALDHGQCDDGNVCTDDVCDAAVGCTTMANSNPCNDGLACTANDVCADGTCGGADSCPNGMECDADVGQCVSSGGDILYTAFNDLAWRQGQLATNITWFTSPAGGSGLPSTGVLVDHDTGDPTGVTLTVTGGNYNGGGHSTDGRNAPAGTDAFEIFDGAVETLGAVAYVNAPNNPLVLTLTGLEPGTLYNLALHSDRGSYGWDRASQATLSGAVVFTNDSSAANDNPAAGSGGALFSGPADASTRLPANNPNGYVARFVEIDPGPDGQVVLTLTADGNAGYRGKYASALMLQALGGGCQADAECEDGNPCTDNACDVGTGSCTSVNNQAACEDGVACTVGDQCSDGTCVAGGADDGQCDDGNVCTDDMCNVVLDCQHANNVAPCDDGAACTENDVCGGGTCGGDDTCPAGQMCDAGSDQCVDEPDCLNDADCNDDNPCTDDVCDQGSGQCQNDANQNGCDDGIACTQGDTCANGVCGGGVPNHGMCNDNNLCTNDTCDAQFGCQYVNNAIFCNDGVACTQGDRCADGVCGAGVPNHGLCNDGNACTDDVCDLVNGCGNPNNVAPCDDGIACTDNDVCADGACAGEESCTPGRRCEHETGQCVATPIQDWVAYNDLALTSGGNAPNTTSFDYQAANGALVDFDTGAQVPITVTGTTVGGYDPKMTGGNLPGNTDGDDLFGNIISLAGIAELDAPHWRNTITFNNLDPAKRYSIALTANRNYGGYAEARYTRVTIVGADLAVNASTPGVMVNGEDSVSFSTGYNGAGYVARWTDILALNGSFSVVSEWDSNQGGGSRNTKGYAMAAFQLIQTTIPPPPCFADPNFVLIGQGCSEGVGECLDTGNWVCNDQTEVVYCDAVPSIPQVEMCNGRDDDCDAQIDNGFDVGDACSVGLGACLRHGAQQCTPDGQGTECSAVPGQASQELCGTGIDENCNGAVDEGFPPLGIPCAEGIGACRDEGATVCTPNRLAVECSAEPGQPTPELCGTGTDENCDGNTNEGYEALGNECALGIGACRESGNRVCTPDLRNLTCDAVPGQPSVELCGTGIDENCNNLVDEGFLHVGQACAESAGDCVLDGQFACTADLLDVLCDTTRAQPLFGAVVEASNAAPATDEVTSAMVVSAGAEFGVVWAADDGARSHAYFTRVQSDGTLPVPDLELSGVAGDADAPSVAWSGASYLAAWTDTRDGGSEEIYAQRIAADGSAIDVAMRLTDDAALSTEPAVAWSDGLFGLAWVDTRAGNQEIFFSTLQEDGTVVADNVRITADFARSFSPTIAFNYAGFGVAFVDHRSLAKEVYFVRLSETGLKVTEEMAITAGSNDPKDLAMLWTGQTYGLTWVDNPTGNDQIFLAGLTHQGSVIDAIVPLTDGTSNATEPSGVWTGTGFGLTWVDDVSGSPAIYFGEIAATGEFLGEATMVVDELGASQPHLTWDGAEYALSWRDGRSGVQRVYFGSGLFAACPGAVACDPGTYEPVAECGMGVCLEASTPSDCVGGFVQSCEPGIPDLLEAYCDGRDEDCNGVVDDVPTKLGPDIRLTDTAFVVESPQVAWSGTELGVVWHDERASSGEIYFMRVSPNGTPIGDHVLVTDFAPGARAQEPHIVWAHGEYGVAWTDNRNGNDDIYFARVSAAGQVLGANTQVTADPATQKTPTIAWNGDAYGIAWRDVRGGQGLEIYFALVGADGVKMGADVRITDDPGGSVSPALAWSGTEFGMVWRDFREGLGDVYFTRISADGVKLGGDIQATDLGSSITPSLTWAGDGYGVVFLDDSAGGTTQMFFARLTATGDLVGDVIAVTADDTDSYTPSVVWTGSQFSLFWDESDGNFRETFTNRVSSDGVLMGASAQISDAMWRSHEPSVAWTGNGFLAVWNDFRDQTDELYLARGPFGDCSSVVDCQAGVVAETCNGLDDDCDGVIDEDCADNAAPSAFAGDDETVSLVPWQVMDLAGAVDDDGQPAVPGAVNATWSVVDGPAAVTFGDAALATTTALFAGPGVYTLELSADDGALITTDQVVITVERPTLRIMPLGNSITSATDGGASFRYWLWHDLIDAGHDVDFVGSMQGVYNGVPRFPDFDQDHEGHWGWRIDEIIWGESGTPGNPDFERLETWAATFDPHIALIHLGTNDLIQPDDGNVPLAILELTQVIDILRNQNPNIAIVLAQIIPTTVFGNHLIPQLNGQIAGLAVQGNTPESPLVLVNQWLDFIANVDTYDGIHPNEQGEIKMSDKWFDALVNQLFD